MGNFATDMRAATARCSTAATRRATCTPGTGLKRPTMIGHVAAPMPQHKFTAPSAAAACAGVSRATIRFVAGTTNPRPMPATAIADVPTRRSPKANPARPAAMSA